MAKKKGQFKKGGGRIGDKKGRRSVAKKKGGNRRRSQPTIPLALVAGMAPGVIDTVFAARTGDPVILAAVPLRDYTGFDMQHGRFDASFMQRGLFPLLAGALVHRFIGGGLGINRALGAARVPLLRL